MTDTVTIGILAAFAFGWTPCIGAVLGAVLAVSASGTGAALQIGGGLVLVAFGFAMIAGRLADLSIWLLDVVPALGRLG